VFSIAFPPPAATETIMAAAAAGEDSILRKLSTLLQEARPSASALRAAAEEADEVAELIKKIPEQQATPGFAQGFVRDLGVDSEKLGFTFKPPEVVQVAGSFAAGTVASPDVAADLLVRLPKVCAVLPSANAAAYFILKIGWILRPVGAN
jgi:U3 small nucleolar RNA-associated protein 22